MIRLNIPLVKVNNSSKIQKSLATCKALPQIVEKSIPEAADGSTERLNVVAVPAHIAIVEVQVAEPGVVAADLSSTPEESVVSNIAETTTATAKTTWEN